MPRICYFYGILILMHYNDHNPPHFHVVYGDYSASIEIESLTVMDGFLPPRAKSLVMEWGNLHQQDLRQLWNLARQHKPLFRVEPLE